MISRLIAGFQSTWQLIAWLAGYFRRAFKKPKTKARILVIFCGFCGEVSVLVAVFPILEYLLRVNGITQEVPQAGASAMPSFGTVATISGIVVVSFLVGAVIIAIIIEEIGGGQDNVASDN